MDQPSFRLAAADLRVINYTTNQRALHGRRDGLLRITDAFSIVDASSPSNRRWLRNGRRLGSGRLPSSLSVQSRAPALRSVRADVAGPPASVVDQTRREIDDLAKSIKQLQKQIRRNELSQASQSSQSSQLSPAHPPNGGRRLPNPQQPELSDSNEGSVDSPSNQQPMPLRPANEIRARVDHLVERAQALQVMASQGSMSSSGRVPVQIAANLKALRRDFNSVHNIIRLSAPSYLSDTPPSPPSSPSSRPQSRSQTSLPAASSSSILPSPYFVHDAISSPLESSPSSSSQEPEVVASGRASDRPSGSSAAGPFSTYSFSTSSPSVSPPSSKGGEDEDESTMKFRFKPRSSSDSRSMTEIRRRVQEQLSSMATDMEASATQLGIIAPASMSPPATSQSPSSAAAAAPSAPSGGDSPAAASLPSLWARLSDRLSQAFRTLLSPPPSRASRSSPALPLSRTSPSASSRSAPPSSAASSSSSASSPIQRGKAAVGGAEEASGGASVGGKATSLARLVGEVRAKGSLIDAADEALEEESRRLQGKADELSAAVRGRLSVDDVQAVVGAAVGNVQSELVRARTRTKQLVAQLEIKDSELRLRREEWEKERAAMVATLDALVRKGTQGKSEGGAGGEANIGNVGGGEVIGQAGMEGVASGAVLTPVEAMTRGMSLTDAMMRVLSLEAAVARAEEAEQATSVRLERVADVLGREIAKLRKDKKSIEVRAQMLTWRLEMMQQKLEGLLGGLLEIKDALIGGKVELGVQLLEELVFDVETWTRQGKKMLDDKLLGLESGKGAARRVEKEEGGGKAGEKGEGEEGEEGGRGKVRAGWWKEAPPGEWSVYEEREDGRLVELGEERREQEERRKREEQEAAREAEERERQRLLEEEREKRDAEEEGEEERVEEREEGEVEKREGETGSGGESEREGGALEVAIPRGDDVDQSGEEAGVQIGGGETGKGGDGEKERSGGATERSERGEGGEEKERGGVSEPSQEQHDGEEEEGMREEAAEGEAASQEHGDERGSSEGDRGRQAEVADEGEKPGWEDREQEEGEEEGEKVEGEETAGKEEGCEESVVAVEVSETTEEGIGLGGSTEDSEDTGKHRGNAERRAEGSREGENGEEGSGEKESGEGGELHESPAEGAAPPHSEDSKEGQEPEGGPLEGERSEGVVEGGVGLGGESAGVTLYYETGWADVFVHFSADGAGWTDVPGSKMAESPLVGSNGLPLKVISLSVTAMEFVTNNGGTDWDSPPLGGNYTITNPGTYLLRLGQVESFTPS
ncbi:hypothetical protein CLOM_g7708 [Closterium sp. NIES-68]|nr:hypothetical protein CLOM_g7708 [Closterium sp. NIES-68]GJP62980.1 hypothetical protein CLOP_g20036 [Closterium sp. NIES-67]